MLIAYGGPVAALIIATLFLRLSECMEKSSANDSGKSNPASEQRITRARLRVLQQTAIEFKGRFGYPPPSLGALLAISPSLSKDGYLDEWGRPFLFQSNSVNCITLYSFGADGQPGGTGTNSDQFGMVSF